MTTTRHDLHWFIGLLSIDNEYCMNTLTHLSTIILAQTPSNPCACPFFLLCEGVRQETLVCGGRLALNIHTYFCSEKCKENMSPENRSPTGQMHITSDC